MTYGISPPNFRPPPVALPYVTGERDEKEAFDAYLTLDSLLAY